MSTGGGGDGGAGQAAAAEAARQKKITQGIAAIDRIFDGSNTGTGAVNNPVAGTGYYLNDGTPVTLSNMQVLNPAYTQWQKQNARAPNTPGYRPGGGFRRGTGTPPPQYLQRLGYNGPNGPVYAGDPGVQFFSGTQHSGGFDDAFYNGIKDKYVDFADPQLEDQYNNANKELTYQLYRQGIASSTGAGIEEQKLNKQYNQYRTDIASQGQAQADDVRKNIANAKANIINQLTATEDPASAQQTALQTAAMYSKPPPFDPVGSFVFNVGSGLYNAGLNGGMNGPINQYVPNQSMYSTSPYTGSSNAGSVRYVN